MEKAMRKLKTMDDVLLDGKTVLLRVDYNVAVGQDGVVDKDSDYRLEASLPTIEELMQRRCKVVLLTHLGRPGEGEGNFEVDPIRVRLEGLLNEEIKQLNTLSGANVNAVVDGMESGRLAILPNVRNDEREMSPNTGFAKELMEVAEVYINEAFSVCHRDHTSVAVVPTLLPSAAGRRTVLEYEMLSKLAHEPERPYVAIISGAKVHTKVALINNLLKHVDSLCVGGRIANTFLAAKGYCTARQSGAEDIETAGEIIKQAGDKLVLPTDVVIGCEKDERMVINVRDISEDVESIWDLGQETIDAFLKRCKGAKTIMWNGPVGKFEEECYAQGTNELAKGLADMKTDVVVGGGETALALERIKLVNKFKHVSVGGGAMVAVLDGSRMPGLEPLYA